MSDQSSSDLLTQTTSRRRFLRDAGIPALAAPVPSNPTPPPPVGAAVDKPKPAGQTGGTMGANDTAAGNTQSAADAMDAMHEKGIKAFPAKTAGEGNQLLAPTIQNGVKVYELTAKKIQWE